MGTTISPVSLSVSLNFNQSSLQTHLSPSVSRPCLRYPSPRPKKIRTKMVTFGRKLREPNESMFFDENGVVEDMDGYLNYLSLEYDSVWDTKPAWCQPWTITLTGASVIACSWLILHSVLVTAVAFLVIGAWWYIFLYSYPKAYSDMIAERRKRVNDGVEDTYGQKKNF